MTHQMTLAAAAFALALGATQSTSAEEINILVANQDTPAYAAAKGLANDSTVFAERKLHKALNRAREILRENKEATLNIKVAAGKYVGKGGKGGFGFSEVISPGATFRMLGGYDDSFTKRAPFTNATILSGATAFVMGGKKHALKEFYFSGFMMDGGSGNSYDGKTNSLLKGSSHAQPIFQIGYLTTDRLVIADCVFINSSHKAAAPLIRAMTKKAEVIVRNNFIMNNILAWELDSARFRNIPATYTVEGNSFVLNWPYNPDPTTGNPGALQIAGKYAAAKVVVKDNLFAYNCGGAIYPTFSDTVGPPMEIKHNLFFTNGALFGLTDKPEAGAIVGKFGGFMSREIPWNVLDIETVEDDYEWKSEGNVVLDPKAPVSMVEAGFANSNDVGVKKTRMNDLRGLLGMNKQGKTMKVSNYAPRMALDPAGLPFPAEPKAKDFGVKPERVEQF